MDHLHLPSEIAEHIVSFIPGPSQQSGGVDHNGRHTVLACALVCKTWLYPARRRLLSLYFPTGTVLIEILKPHTITNLANLLKSPLCTLDPGFIKILAITQDFSKGAQDTSPRSFLAPLSALDGVSLPSLHGLTFYDNDMEIIRLKDNDDSLPPPALLSQIKILDIETLEIAPFPRLADIIRLCPLLEEVIISGPFNPRQPACKEYLSFQPPKLLRKLQLDLVSFRNMARWFMTCQPNHMNITAISISDFQWSQQYCWDLWPFLDKVGLNLELFEVHFAGFVYGYHVLNFIEGRSVLNKYTPPLDWFAKNTSLKKFAIGAPLDILIELLLFFFGQPHFAPRLEQLEVTISAAFDHLTQLKKLTPLDELFRSRSSLTRVIFNSSDLCLGGFQGVIDPEVWGTVSLEVWEEIKCLIKSALSGCEVEGMVEFRRLPFLKGD